MMPAAPGCCEVCAGPLRSDNRTGICVRTPACRRGRYSAAEGPRCRCGHGQDHHDASMGPVQPCDFPGCGCLLYRAAAVQVKTAAARGGPGPFTGVGRRRAEHGTSSGYQQHIAYGIPPCGECKKARAAYIRDWRRLRDQAAGEAS